MSKGAFIVARDPNNNKDILFQITATASSVPKDQMKLKEEVEKTLVVLREILEGDKFEQYFDQALSLSQAGLVGDAASPDAALSTLWQLQDQVVANEAGRIKNEYMKKLGKSALELGVPVSLLATCLYYFTDWELVTFLFLWCGSLVGTWISFGTRKNILKFADLNILEEDRLDPSIRLIFAGLLTLIVGLFLTTHAFIIKVGQMTTEQIGSDLKVALLIGVLCGISEKVLPSKISQKASQLIKF